MKSYKELEVWQKSVNLAIETYRMAKKFPNEERFGLIAQIQRATTSVPANIAEGWGRGSTKEYIQFLLIARGSLMELETHLIIAHQLDYLSKDELEQLQKEIENIGKMLNRLIQTLRAR
ncbi:MAG: four helix bundle protein [Proteobacteria bacterium]|nr:four helix bundle protein [Pseudomonadota bacterium]